MSSSINVENYHLKWDSHLSYLNLSVATLFKNEKFADVMLLSSNPEGGLGIPAHRIILSSCSDYFASIFEVTPSTPNSVIYIILPPELSRRSIQILVQYMYSGEATVSNDILSEVLRGGEILKIRGLYRSGSNNTQAQSNHIANDHKSGHPYSTSDVSRNLEPACCIRSDHDKQLELRGIGASATVLPKESPVIVRSPKPAQHSTTTNGPLNLSSASQISQNISVKKDVAIDPDDNCISSICYGNESIQKITQHIPENLCKNFSTPLDRLLPPERDKSRRHSEEVSSLRDDCGSITRKHRDEEQIRIDRRRTSLPDAINSYPNGRRTHNTEQDRHIDEDIPEPLNFLTIKQEPVDWHGDTDNENNTLPSKPPPSLDVVKTESITSVDEDRHTDKEEEIDLIYSPLSCELCGETFTIPREWVRHIESHMDCKTSYVPKKKRRISTSSTDILPSLKCELCTTHYATPAEWVRHIQTEHTETELAMCNNRHDNHSLKGVRQPSTCFEYLSHLGKTCDVCNKKFPSYASMVIHSRTHTGEKPFHCSPCNKGFNVKSNLLRHMRTLHNQFEPSTSVSDNANSPCENDAESEIEQT